MSTTTTQLRCSALAETFRQPLLMLCMMALLSVGCNLILGNDGIKKGATTDASTSDAQVAQVARVGVFIAGAAESGLEILFHSLDGQPFAQVNTAGDGYAEIETDQMLMATLVSENSGGTLWTTFVGPNQQTIFGFFGSVDAAIDVVIDAGPTLTNSIDVRVGVGTAIAPANGGTISFTRAFTTLLRRDRSQLDAIAIAKTVGGESLGVARRLGVPLTMPTTTVTLPATYEAMVPYEVRGTTLLVTIKQVFADRAFRIDQSTAGSVAGRTLQLADNFGTDVELQIQNPFASERWFRKRMAFEAGGVDVDPNWEAALPNLTGVTVRAFPEGEVLWDSYPQSVELAEIELGFDTSTTVDRWFIEAPANLGKVTLPQIVGIDFGSTASLTAMTVSDFSGYDNFAEYAAAKDSESFHFSLLPEHGELHGIRWMDAERNANPHSWQNSRMLQLTR